MNGSILTIDNHLPDYDLHVASPVTFGYSQPGDHVHVQVMILGLCHQSSNCPVSECTSNKWLPSCSPSLRFHFCGAEARACSNLRWHFRQGSSGKVLTLPIIMSGLIMIYDDHTTELLLCLLVVAVSHPLLMYSARRSVIVYTWASSLGENPELSADGSVCGSSSMAVFFLTLSITTCNSFWVHLPIHCIGAMPLFVRVLVSIVFIVFSGGWTALDSLRDVPLPLATIQHVALPAPSFTTYPFPLAILVSGVSFCTYSECHVSCECRVLEQVSCPGTFSCLLLRGHTFTLVFVLRSIHSSGVNT